MCGDETSADVTTDVGRGGVQQTLSCRRHRGTTGAEPTVVVGKRDRSTRRLRTHLLQAKCRCSAVPWLVCQGQPGSVVNRACKSSRSGDCGRRQQREKARSATAVQAGQGGSFQASARQMYTFANKRRHPVWISRSILENLKFISSTVRCPSEADDDQDSNGPRCCFTPHSGVPARAARQAPISWTIRAATAPSAASRTCVRQVYLRCRPCAHLCESSSK